MDFDQFSVGYFSPVKCNTVTPLREGVIVSDINFGERTTASGIIIRSDDGKSHGIYPRWGKVYSVGPEQKDVVPGQWVLIEHGRWTRGFTIENDQGEKTTLWKAEETSILLVSDEQPEEYGTLNSEAVYA